MSNDCDIEELKHIALQKFIELADVDCWVSLNYPCSYTGGQRYEYGKYRAEHQISYIDVYCVYLGEECVSAIAYPVQRSIKQTTTGRAVKADADKAAKEYNEAIEKFEATPAIIAYRKIDKRQKDKDCQKREEAMKKAMEESCKRLQEVLAGDPTEETVFQKVAREREAQRGVAPEDVFSEYVRPKRWWEVWK